MDKFTQITRQPEYAHLLLNHLPIVGLATALLFLAGALCLRHRPTTVFALGLVGAFALSSVLVVLTGEAALNRVLGFQPADPLADVLLKIHAEEARRWAPLLYATGALAWVAAGAAWRSTVVATWGSLGIFLLGLVCVWAAAQVAEVGGQVKHRELRINLPAGVERR